MILETVTGTNGVIVPPDGYLQSIREVCDRHGILLICDEVMAGFGRTGKWFACEHWDVVPGHPHRREGHQLRLRAARRDGHARADRRLGAATSTSPAASPTAAIRSRARRRVASIEAFQEEGIVENSAAMGEVFRAELRALAEKHPSIGEVRGLGCFWGARARAEPRDARAARAVQRDGRGREADRAARRRRRSSAASTS